MNHLAYIVTAVRIRHVFIAADRNMLNTCFSSSLSCDLLANIGYNLRNSDTQLIKIRDLETVQILASSRFRDSVNCFPRRTIFERPFYTPLNLRGQNISTPTAVDILLFSMLLCENKAQGKDRILSMSGTWHKEKI